MVILLVILTIVVAISVEWLVRYFARGREGTVVRRDAILFPALAKARSVRVPQFPEDLFYHKGHAWMKFEGNNRIKIGLDDFTQQVMGDLDEIEIPSPGTELKQGEVAWSVSNGTRKLNQLAPLGGRVVAVNEKLRRDPTLANRSPYEEGWIATIQGKALKKEMAGLMDAFQFKAYFDQCKAKLMSSFNKETLGMAYGDGGEIVQGAASKLDDKTWRALVTQFFHCTSEEA